MRPQQWALERAMRVWALTDEVVAANVRKSDGRVLRAVYQAFLDAGFDAEDAGGQIGRLLRGGNGRAARLGSRRRAGRDAGPLPRLRAPALARRLAAPVPSSVEVLEQLVGGQFDVLVPPLRCAVDAGDQARAVDPAQIAVDERVPGLGVVWAPSVRPRCHPAYSSHEWFSRNAFCASARGCTSPSRCPARTAARRSTSAPWSAPACSPRYLAIQSVTRYAAAGPAKPPPTTRSSNDQPTIRAMERSGIRSHVGRCRAS